MRVILYTDSTSDTNTIRYGIGPIYVRSNAEEMASLI